MASLGGYTPMRFVDIDHAALLCTQFCLLTGVDTKVHRPLARNLGRIRTFLRILDPRLHVGHAVQSARICEKSDRRVGVPSNLSFGSLIFCWP